MNTSERAYNAFKTDYDNKQAAYDISYAAYEPYENGITAARTNFSNDFSTTTKSAEYAWNILYLSENNIAITGVPSNPSVGEVAFSKNRMETFKRSMWNNRIAYY